MQSTLALRLARPLTVPAGDLPAADGSADPHRSAATSKQLKRRHFHTTSFQHNPCAAARITATRHFHHRRFTPPTPIHPCTAPSDAVACATRRRVCCDGPVSCARAAAVFVVGYVLLHTGRIMGHKKEQKSYCQHVDGALKRIDNGLAPGPSGWTGSNLSLLWQGDSTKVKAGQQLPKRNISNGVHSCFPKKKKRRASWRRQDSPAGGVESALDECSRTDHHRRQLEDRLQERIQQHLTRRGGGDTATR